MTTKAVRGPTIIGLFIGAPATQHYQRKLRHSGLKGNAAVSGVAAEVDRSTHWLLVCYAPCKT
jgi:hypothetical protein